MKNSEKYYLKEGVQTKITSRVRKHAKLAKQIELNSGKNLHKNLQLALKVTKYILVELKKHPKYKKPESQKELEEQRKLKETLFRKRTLDEILEEGYYPTCSDIGIVFRGLMITLGVPTAYVEAFHEDYLLDKNFHGHVLGKVKAGNKWYYIDPENNQKRISKTEYELFPLIIFKEGLDSWDVGIKSYGDMHKLKKQNIKTLVKKYKEIVQDIADQKIKEIEKVHY